MHVSFSLRKILVCVTLFARNSGAGNGCANFMGVYQNCVLSKGENLHAHNISCSRGGIFWVFGRGSADFIFMGAGEEVKCIAFWVAFL